MIRLKTLREVPIKGKRVLIRSDLNVPLAQDGTILDDSRIRASLSTIRFILEKGGSAIVMSHLGRPEGRDVAYSMGPVAKRLSELLAIDVL